MPLKAEVVEIKYNTDQHRRVLAALKQRFQLSYDYMSRRHDAWKTAEERYKSYVNLAENDRVRKELRRDGKPQYVTVDVPYSYAMLLTAHTYWTSVFLGRSPVLQYQGNSGEAQTSEQAVEAIMNYQFGVAQMQTPLAIWLMDAGKYGLGVVGNSWADECVYTSKIVEVPAMYYGVPLPWATPKKQRQTVKVPAYQGNRLFNIRPQDFYPDPRVPISQLQRGEFCGHRTEIGWNTVILREQEGYYFNVAVLQDKIRAARGDMRDLGSSQMNLPAEMDTLYYRESLQEGKNPDRKKSFVETKVMTVQLVPKDWGLGTSPYPEKWAFEVGNDEVIICAMPQGAYHGKFEYDALEYEIEGYEHSKRGMLEILDPLNEVLTWLFNSHMYNVRKMVNDQMVVDPSRIMMKDLTDPASGRLVRLKPDAYGTDPKLTVHQLSVVDVTMNHLRDAEVVMEMMQRVVGATENIMGMVNSGGRKTATEVRTSSTFGVNRLKTNAEYFSSMGFAPMAQRMLQNTQQHFDQRRNFRIVGDILGSGYMAVGPEEIAGEFDFVAVDGTMPIDRFAMANLWKEMLPVMSGIPQIAVSTDWVKLMQYVAQLGGIKNFNGFKINIVPDAKALLNAQAGNADPLQGGEGGTNTGAGGERNFNAIPGAASVAGVGRTG